MIFRAPEALATLLTDPAGVIDQMAAIGVEGMTDYALDFLQGALPRVVSILVIIVITFIVLRLLRSTVQQFVRKLLERRDEPPRDLTQKAQTLASVIESTGKLFILIMAGMLVLTNLGIQIAPLIASAGVAGLAIGLGAQSLIRDMINGFLILFENQYGVGDFVRIDPVSGTVEELNLRRTVLRSVDGAAIVIPNGEVRIIENLSKGWSRAIIDMNVSTEADDNQVMAVLHEIFDDVQLDPDVGSKIVEEPTILGLTTVSANHLTYRVMIKTLPSEQWAVERALRGRLRDRLIARGIPFPGALPAALADIVDGPG